MRSGGEPTRLYTAEQVRALDRCAIETFHIDGYVLMQRAAAAAAELLRFRWPSARNVAVICGGGNNGGDGFVVARLLSRSGLSVKTGLFGHSESLGGDAKRAYDDFAAAGGQLSPLSACIHESTDLIVDSLFGNGLSRDIDGEAADVVEQMNSSAAQVLSIDVPSGVCSDTGSILGCAVRASATISFIAHKRGLFTADGPDCSGDLYLDDLDVPTDVFASQPCYTHAVSEWEQVAAPLSRTQNYHKGMCGHVLIIGGNQGYAGAAHLAGRACLKVGAGRVTVACHVSNGSAFAATPELMTRPIENPDQLADVVQQLDVIAIGPGLATDGWAQNLLTLALDSGKPLVVDADALNLLAKMPDTRLSSDSVLTPHPAEAARLLGTTTSAIQADRFSAAQSLHRKYGSTVLLKGNGTIVCVADATTLIEAGNAGMATAGMGDVLTGVVAGMLGQGMAAEEAAVYGALLHARAGDEAAGRFAEGLIAGDVIESVAGLLTCQQ